MVTVNRIAASAAAVVMAPLVAARTTLIIYNDSQGFLLVRPGAAPTSTLFTNRIPPNDHWDVPPSLAYADVYGLWTNDISGGALVTEGT